MKHNIILVLIKFTIIKHQNEIAECLSSQELPENPGGKFSVRPYRYQAQEKKERRKGNTMFREKDDSMSHC